MQIKSTPETTTTNTPTKMPKPAQDKTKSNTVANQTCCTDMIMLQRMNASNPACKCNLQCMYATDRPTNRTR
jgi:hypothetical protein